MKAEHALLYICGIVLLIAIIDLIIYTVRNTNDRRKK